MTFIEKIRSAILEKRVSPIFCRDDLKAADIDDPNYNLSNYDKKNQGAKNKKYLVSREIDRVTYYTFDEQLLP